MTLAPKIDFERLFKLRLIVARHGEMDGARWWNTNGVLGRRGAAVYRRGFPTTHRFVQAKVVFAVARSRCDELFSPALCMTLWSLPAEIEDRFEEEWHGWLDEAERWLPLFDAVEDSPADDLLERLAAHDLLSEEQRDSALKLRRGSENRAVPLPGVHDPNDDVITMLAAGFVRGEPGNPAVPYARLQT